MPEFDRSEYEYSEYEKYISSRTSTEGLVLDRANCRVQFDEKNRLVKLFCDPFFAEQYESLSEKHTSVPTSVKRILAYGKEAAEGKPMEHFEMKDANAELDTLTKHFNITFRDEKKVDKYHAYEYYENAISGSTVTFALGEGLLDFCYFDIEKNAESLNVMFSLFSKQGRDIKTLLSGNMPEPERPIVIKDAEQNAKFFDDMWKETNKYCREFFYNSLYTAVFSPIFMECNSEMHHRYVDYLLFLQAEFREKMQFCFDPEFYPSALGNMTPTERYAIYCGMYKGFPSTQKRTESFAVITEKKAKTTYTETAEYKDFIEKYCKDKTKADLISNHCSVELSYACSTIFDMLNLEFTKMLETDIRLRKCKRCGRYFIMKGNYDTNYCDRILEGQTRTCQELAAQDNYKAKAAENPALKIYSKYYKRFAARLRSKQLKEKDFNTWRYQAITKRNDCLDGKITTEEYVQWLEGYFSKKKAAEASDK